MPCHIDNLSTLEEGRERRHTNIVHVRFIRQKAKGNSRRLTNMWRRSTYRAKWVCLLNLLAVQNPPRPVDRGDTSLLWVGSPAGSTPQGVKSKGVRKGNSGGQM